MNCAYPQLSFEVYNIALAQNFQFLVVLAGNSNFFGSLKQQKYTTLEADFCLYEKEKLLIHI